MMSTLALCVIGSMLLADGAVTINAAQQRPVMLVQFQSNLDNMDALFATLSVANKLHRQENDVVLFLDLKAVTLADREIKHLSASRRAEAKTLLDEFVARGGRIIVCPHCAKQIGLSSSSLRKGAVMTSKDELLQLRRLAEKIYEYHEPDKRETAKSSI